MMSFGSCFRCSLMSSVRPPSPMDVKKLMLNLMFRGVSFGKTPATQGLAISSDSRALSAGRPIASDSSWNRILMKIRALLVVASSVNTMFDRTPQLIASVERR